MSSPFGRAVVSLILAPYVAIAGALPQDHVHEADTDHPRSVAHRHVQLHDEARPDHDHAQLAEDDGHVVWLVGATLNQRAYQLTPAVVAAFAPHENAPAHAWVAGFDYSTPPPHGPPRDPASLRAPPASLLQ